MHVTVEDGRATAVKGDPEHPITHGFLCGKVSNYLDRVYSDQRILHPLVREDGELRRASWDEALDLVAAGLRRAIDTHGGESILPYSYAGTQGLVQGNLMSQRVMNVLGSSELVRTICATAGLRGVAATHGISPEVDPEEWPHARYLLLWGWNPMSTAPHLWRLLLETHRRGARLVVVDPFRSKTARLADEHLQPLPGTDAALALGMMRAIRDAGLVDEDWCRAYATGLDDLLEQLEEWPLDRAAEADRRARRGHRAGRARLRPHPARTVAARRGSPAPSRRPGRLQHGRLAARPRRSLAAPRRRLLLHPHRNLGRGLVLPRRPPRPAGEASAGGSTCRSSETPSAGTWTRRSRHSWFGTRIRPRWRRTRPRCSPAWSAPTCSRWCWSSS